MTALVLDCETTTLNEGNPFDKRNRLCAVALHREGRSDCRAIEYDLGPYADALADVQREVDDADVLVFFNAKFDMHWLRRYGIRLEGKRIFCVQLAYFTVNAQTPVMPSLGHVCQVLKCGEKSDHIEKYYWSVGIDTPDIPWEELATYAINDVAITYAAYQALVVPAELRSLVSLGMQDLVVLQEMEWNGLNFNLERAREKATELKPKLEELNKNLEDLVGLPSGVFNSDSPAHISAFLFGGVITHEWKEQEGVFKTGKRIGEPRMRWHSKDYVLPRLCRPPNRSETAKEGVWQTNAKTLGMLNVVGKARKFLDVLAEYSEVEKLVGTYYVGIPAIADKYGWNDGIIHGQYNQTVAVTGRLSSSKPNLQNLDGTVDELIESRYAAN